MGLAIAGCKSYPVRFRVREVQAIIINGISGDNITQAFCGLKRFQDSDGEGCDLRHVEWWLQCEIQKRGACRASRGAAATRRPSLVTRAARQQRAPLRSFNCLQVDAESGKSAFHGADGFCGHQQLLEWFCAAILNCRQFMRRFDCMSAGTKRNNRTIDEYQSQ